MNKLLDQITQRYAEYQALLPLSDENRRRLEQKFRLEFNFNSNHLEGNTLTYGETALLLLHDDTKGDHHFREYEEMKAHDVAWQLVQQWAADERPITEADVKNLNKILLVRPFWKEAITPDGQNTRRLISVGEYKSHPNSVRLSNGELFEYTSPLETPARMQELMDWFRREDEKRDSHPLLIAALLHYDFVRIHPFDDGNGRVSRLLMNYALLRFGYPPLIVKSADKSNYLRALNRADVGDKDAFVRYLGEQLLWSLDMAIKAAKGENIEEPDDLDKELAVLAKALGGKPGLKHEYNVENVADVVELCLFPFFKEIENKLAILTPLFFSCSRKLSLYSSGHGVNYNEILVKDWTEVLENWLAMSPRAGVKKFSELRYHYILEGLKSNESAPDVTIFLEIKFNPYNYSIKDAYFPYGSPFSKEQIRKLAEPHIKAVSEQIKRLSGIKDE